MPPARKKTSSKARGRRRKAGVSRALVVMTVLLAVAAAGGIGGLTYLRSPKGQAVLLDHDLGDYYAVVQENLGAALGEALDGAGMENARKVRARIVNMEGRRVRVYEWTVRCDASTDFVLVNVAMTDAARRAGGRVRKTEEREHGRVLVVEAGTNRFDTHRITLRKSVDRAAVVKPPPEPSESIPRVAIVIDDYGYTQRGVAVEMLQLDLPLTISVLPGLRGSVAMLDRSRNTGHCTLLHLPMEADGDDEYDSAPVTTAMSEAEITGLVDGYLEELSGVDGVNNHQGSLATTDPRVMRAVLRVIESHDLFFLDSLTSPKSVAYNVARELGVPAARNRLFLDADTDDPYVIGQRLHQLVELARRHGSAIGIAHPHRWTLDALLDGELYLKNSGVALVSVCALVDVELSQSR